MSWKKYFTPVKSTDSRSPISGDLSIHSTPRSGRANYSNFLPDVYTGHPNRLERYQQYNTIDSDPEINAALDILAEFCTQSNDDNGTPFRIFFREQATSTEIKIIKKYLQQWSKLNKFDLRMFKIVRNAFKYGDGIFARDPETFKLMYVDPVKLSKIIVNESEGKLPEQYVVRDINVNLQTLSVTQINLSNQTMAPSGVNYITGAAQQRGMTGAYPNAAGTRFSNNQNETAIDAKHIIHLSMSEGLDDNYPFGTSLLECVFKVYKQKELLEDAILIYRIQRAPERRIFYIDVGNMPSHLAMSYVERVKQEVNQRRIPSSTGGGQSMSIDASYNPLSIGDDFFFPTSAEGRGSKVETLPGGCFAMDTKVSLLDGRELTIAEIEAEMKLGETLWTYSCEPNTGKIVPGLITWAGVTQKSAKVMRITLDNGESVVCTPEHPFVTRHSGFANAETLSVGDSLMPLYRRIKNNTVQYLDNFTGDWLKSDEQLGLTAIAEEHLLDTHNHSITSIEYLDEPTEVGTLTIDGEELLHDYHTFALSCGIMVKNSSLGEISDLMFFTQKLMRALRIPSSYLPTGVDDSQATFNDGRVGTAYIQELRFNKYCERLQSMLISPFDNEFKAYLASRGVNIDFSLFDLKFNPPQNFAAYRQAEMDNTRVNVYGSVSQIPHLSKRFALKRFLGLSAEEMAENEKLWMEENTDKNGRPNTQAELRGAGITAGGLANDLGSLDAAGGPTDEMVSDMGGAGTTPPPEIP